MEITPAQREQLTLEHTTLLEQLRITRSEIDQLLGASRQIVHLTLSIITAILGASFLLGDTSANQGSVNAPLTLLILPFFLYGLAWVQVRYLLIVRKRSDYAHSINQRIIEIIKQMDTDTATGKTTIDEKVLQGFDGSWNSPAGLLFLPVNAAGYVLPLFAALLCVIAAFALPGGRGAWFEVPLAIANILSFIYSLVIGYLVEFKQFGHQK